MGVFVPPAPSDCGLTVGGVWSVAPPAVRPVGLQYAGFAPWDIDDLEAHAAARSGNAVRLSEVGGVDFLARLLCREDRPIVVRQSVSQSVSQPARQPASPPASQPAVASQPAS